MLTSIAGSLRAGVFGSVRIAGAACTAVRSMSTGYKGYAAPAVNFNLGHNSNTPAAPNAAQTAISYLAQSAPASPATSPAAARSAGRSLAVHTDNPGQTYRMLHIMLARNRVRKQLRMRERYEKPTYRRQREKKESDQARFQRSISQKVRIVMQMKNRGM